MTTLFWLIAAALIAGSVVLLVKPLLEASQPAGPEEPEQGRALHRQQCAELSQDLQAGVIGEEQYQQAYRELAQRRLEESGAPATALATRSHVRRWVTVGTVASCVPLISVLLYAKLGNPLAITHSRPPEPETLGGAHQLSQGLDALAEGLKRKLERQPGNGPGWALLARSYVELGRHAESVPAFERAVQLITDDAQLLADYADALGMVNGRSLDGRPTLLINQALAIEPSNPKALLLAATVAVNERDYPRAITYWQRVMAGAPPESALAAEVTAHLAEARSRLGGAPPAPLAREHAPLAPGRRAISGTVRLATDLDGRVAPTDTVFVFARSLDGPPMPLAVLRASADALPLSFRLDDSHSVMPGRRLSEAGTVVVAARISKSGTATPQAGDLQGTSGNVEVGGAGVTIIIDTEVR